MTDPTKPDASPAADTSLSQLRHDFCTPINQILGYSQMLQEDAQELGNKKLTEDLQKIEAAGKRLLEMVDKLVSGARRATDTAPVPESPSKSLPEPAAMEQPGTSRSARTRLLVVDDQEMNRDMLGRRLRQRGFEVELAEGGREALERIARNPPDLVLLDVMMPDVSGLDVLREVRKAISPGSLPIIMATARDASEDVVEALKLGANDYVTKPLDFPVVLARVETQLSLKRANDAVVSLNSQLESVQERLNSILSSSPQAMQDVTAWTSSMVAELARTIGANEVAVWLRSEDGMSSMRATLTRPPSDIELEAAAKSRELSKRGDDFLMPVFGMTGQLLGALVLSGRGMLLGEAQARLISSFASQLGGTLELQRTRENLAAAEEKNRNSRQELIDRGVDLLSLCPKCGRCYDQNATQCQVDGADLHAPRILPYRILNRYRMVRMVGSGGMGTVFEAHDQRLERSVAVKIINPEHFNNPSVRLRFEQEARALARVDHPGVISLYDSGELPEGSGFLVMEMLNGFDLSQILKAYGRGTPRQVAALTRHAGAALSAAHKAGLIHRDIKPANLFLTGMLTSFQVKILDFGVARPVEMDARLTQTGTVLGTPAYMSPEQMLGRDVDQRSDLYSFVAVIFEALTGRRVTLKTDMASIFVDVLNSPPPEVSRILKNAPETLDFLFARGLARRPEERGPDIESWVRDVAPILEAMEVTDEGWPESAGTLISKFRALREDGAELTISIADEANLVSADATQKIGAPEGTVALKPSAESTVVLKTPQAEGTIALQKPAESTVMLDAERGNRQQATDNRNTKSSARKNTRQP